MKKPSMSIEEYEKLRHEEYHAMLKSNVLAKTPHTAPIIPEGQSRLYVVVTIASSGSFGGTRGPGIFTTFDKARNLILNHGQPLWEHSYSLAMIEEIIPDVLYGCCESKHWFQWYPKENLENPTEPDYANGCYLEIEEPEVYKHSVGFVIG